VAHQPHLVLGALGGTNEEWNAKQLHILQCQKHLKGIELQRGQHGLAEGFRLEDVEGVLRMRPQHWETKMLYSDIDALMSVNTRVD
jgi:hypothetical protein